MNLSQQIFSDIIVHMKYARYLPEKNRRETWEELVDRNKQMHIKKYPHLKDEIDRVYQLVLEKKVLPSMRSLQFAGDAIEINPSRINNCSYLPIDSWEAFHEVMFLLLGGVGVGYSVQKHHVDKLPEIIGPRRNRTRRYLIGDSIAGWSDAIKVLMKSYFFGTTQIRFDFSDIRPKGARLITSGGKAPGPQPLKECIVKITGILDEAEQTGRLSTIQCHDILCHIADAVLAGGIRRAAMIAFFSVSDDEMMAAKAGNWWETNPQRGRANNSVVLVRSRINKATFDRVFERLKASGSGEPGFFFTNDKDVLSNPCFSGDSMLLTSGGYCPIKSLVDKNVELIAQDGSVCKGSVIYTGKRDTIKLTFKDGGTLVCTPDHILIDKEGNEVQAKQALKKRLLFGTVQQYKENPLFVKLGFVQGNGELSRLNSTTHKGFAINFGKNDVDVIKYFGYGAEGRRVYTKDFVNICKKLQFDQQTLPYRGLPKTIDTWNMEELASFLKGLWSANGSIVGTKTQKQISLKTTNKKLAKQLMLILKNKFNIDSYITTTKKSYALSIGKLYDIYKFITCIGFIHQYKVNETIKYLNTRGRLVIDVTTNKKEDVYDFTIDHPSHLGIVNDLVVHNCGEISLKPFTFCNLTEVNTSTIESQEDFNERARAAAFLGTLQAGYTDFYYLRPIWKEATEKERLIGVSLTGVASNKLKNLNLEEAAQAAVEENKRVAELIGITPAYRVTTIKPAGTSSIVLGCSSGIHAWHAKYYIRRVTLGKNEPIYAYLAKIMPELLEDDYFRPHDTAKMKIPQSAPAGAITRDESALNLLERIRTFYNGWIKAGHIQGPNTNNISATVSVKEDEWDEVKDWMWKHRTEYNGITLLPYNGGTYKQAPFEECSKYMYDKLFEFLKGIDLTKIKEEEDNTKLQGEIACSGNACEIL